MTMKLPQAARKTLHNAISSIVQKACEKYGSVTGKAMPVALEKFLVIMLSDTIDLILDSSVKGKPLTPKDAAIFALKKALAVSGFGAVNSEAKMMECGISIAALAITSMETVELEEACAAVGATGFASPAAAAVAIGGALYWGYQLLDTAQTCYAAFTAPSKDIIESAFPPTDNIQSERALYTNYANNVCREAIEDETLKISR